MAVGLDLPLGVSLGIEVETSVLMTALLLSEFTRLPHRVHRHRQPPEGDRDVELGGMSCC
jgi:hypothetical protein